MKFLRHPFHKVMTIQDLMDYLSTTKNMHKITLDADALNILSKIEKWWEKFKVPTLITPHMGEYEKLFNVESPEQDKNIDFKELINSNSLKIYNNAYAESNIRDAIKSNYYQFQRIGYFKLDKNSSKENLIFNKTVSLRDSKPRTKFD